MTELRPCPFCGSSDVAVEHASGSGSYRAVWCYQCESQGPSKRDDDAAAYAWNRRPESETREPDGWVTALEVSDLRDPAQGEAVIFSDLAGARYNHDLTSVEPMGELLPVYFGTPPREGK